jgi:hypothetical protein
VKLIWVILIVLFVLVVGCKGGSTGAQGSLNDTNPPVQNMSSTSGDVKSREVPGGIGITAGQSGTGTTSGASTGY